MAWTEQEFLDELEQRLLYNSHIASFWELSYLAYIYRMYAVEKQVRSRSLFRDYQHELAVLKRKQIERRNKI